MRVPTTRRGAVPWVALACRPELAHTVTQLCRYVNAPTAKARVTGGNDPATSQMVADILTKSTPAPLFAVMASIMSGMRR